MNPFNKAFWELGKKEKRSLTHFLILLTLVIMGPLVYESIFGSPPFNPEIDEIPGINPDTLFKKNQKDSMDVFNKQSSEIKEIGKWKNNKNPLDPNFLMDPNSHDWNLWQKTGIAYKTIRTILHYLEKGGIFRKSEDLKRIYNLKMEDFNRIKDHLRFTSSAVNRSGIRYFSKSFKSFMSTKFSASNPNIYGKVHINSAEFQDFRHIYPLSTSDIYRILNFRNRNGFFSDIRELKNLNLLDLNIYKKIEKYLDL